MAEVTEMSIAIILDNLCIIYCTQASLLPQEKMCSSERQACSNQLSLLSLTHSHTPISDFLGFLPTPWSLLILFGINKVLFAFVIFLPLHVHERIQTRVHV